MRTQVSDDSACRDPHYPALKEHIIRSTGLAYYQNQDAALAAKISGRLQCLGLSDCGSYLDCLRDKRAGEAELDQLIEQLTIGETFFFRHRELFDVLRRVVLPRVIQRNRNIRRIRIWSAGCSIGAEPYSISILLRRDLAHLIPQWDITIIGTDVNRSFLSSAVKARFEDWALRGVSVAVKRDCFFRDDKTWVLRPEFLEGVSFQYHNLVKHPFPSMLHNLFAFDVILCRNVLIYFSQELVGQTIRTARRCLVDEGWLLVGHAEHNAELFRGFRTVNTEGAIVYQRCDGEEGWSSSGEPQCPGSERDPPRMPGSPECFERSPAPLQNPPKIPIPLPAERSPADEGSAARTDTADELDAIHLLADRGEIDKAAALCERLVQKHKLTPICHLYHALVLQQLGEYGRVEQSLRRAIYLDREFVLAHYYLGMTLQRLGKHQRAAQSLRNVLQLLTSKDPAQRLDHSDGLSAADLDELTRMQLEAVES